LNIYIIIPAHNEQNVITLTLDSLVKQTLLPNHVVVVNDNSTDETQEIVEVYAEKYKWISLINSKSSNEHLPGSKIINAFYKGLPNVGIEEAENYFKKLFYTNKINSDPTFQKRIGDYLEYYNIDKKFYGGSELDKEAKILARKQYEESLN